MSLVPERGVVAYPRLWLRGVRRELGHTLRVLGLALPGLFVGLWLTGEWASGWAATWVIGLCSVGAVAAGELAAKLVGLLRRQRRERPSPQVVPAVLRREIAVVTPLCRSDPWQAGVLTVLVGVGCWLVLAGATLRTAELRPGWAGAMVVVAVLASLNLWRLLGAALGPRVALFPDRLEIRRGLGRYLVPWSAVAAVTALDGRLTVLLAGPGLTLRRGWVPAHSAYGVRIRNPGMPISTLVGAIEEYRRDPATYRYPDHPGRREDRHTTQYDGT